MTLAELDNIISRLLKREGVSRDEVYQVACEARTLILAKDEVLRLSEQAERLRVMAQELAEQAVDGEAQKRLLERYMFRQRTMDRASAGKLSAADDQSKLIARMAADVQRIKGILKNVLEGVPEGERTDTMRGLLAQLEEV
jgi:hypothetical protein